MYPCRGAKAYAPKRSCAEGLSPKPAGFFMYPCRGVLHTPPNDPRRRFGYKTGQVFGAVLIGKGEIGCVFGASVCGNMKLDELCTYPCRGAKAYAPKCPATMV